MFKFGSTYFFAWILLERLDLDFRLYLHYLINVWDVRNLEKKRNLFWQNFMKFWCIWIRFMNKASMGEKQEIFFHFFQDVLFWITFSSSCQTQNFQKLHSQKQHFWLVLCGNINVRFYISLKTDYLYWRVVN